MDDVDVEDEENSPMMEPTCSPHRMLVLESPSSKRSRMGQQEMDDEREGMGSPFQGGCDEADAAGACSAPHPLPFLPASLPPSPLVGCRSGSARPHFCPEG